MIRLTMTLLALVASIAAMAVAAPAATNVQTVRVTEQSYSIRLSAKPRPGVVRFTVANVSDDGHDFWLRGGGKTWRTRVIGETGGASLTAVLKRGVKYTFWCSVGDHREEGMRGSFVAR